MVTPRPSFSGRAFTLIELDVVIGIIGILMSLLLPMLARVRRQGLIMASPIVYIANDNRVLLTSATGYGEVDLRYKSKMQCPVCHSPPTWSPSGALVALRSYQHKADPALPADRQEQGATTILDPMANTSISIPEDQKKLTRNFVTWIDSDRVVIADRGYYYVTNRRNGATMGWMDTNKTNTKQFLFASPTPMGSKAAFVGVTSNKNTGESTVSFFRKDMKPASAIYIVGGLGQGGAGNVAFPRIDPLGEVVAWSQFKTWHTDPEFPLIKNTWQIMLKDTRTSARSKATIIGFSYRSAAFCDFTESGDLLANVSKDMKTWQLVILDRKGNLIREIPTATPPAPGVVASWRKFGRR